MALTEIVVDGATLGFKETTVTGTVTFTGTPSTKVKALVGGVGKGVYKGPVGFSVAVGCQDTLTTCTSTLPFTGAFSPAAANTKAEGLAPLRADDEVPVSIPGLLSDGVTVCSISATVKVLTPGQDKTKMG